MKLASENDGRRDGSLLLVSRDLHAVVTAADIAPTLQQAVERWAEVCEPLHTRYQQLNSGELTAARPMDARQLLSPLPRSYQWLDGSAYVNHVELVRRARGAEMPEQFWHEPLMYQGGSDDFLSPCDNVPLINESWGLEF